MRASDRIDGLLDDLEQTLHSADQLVARGREAFDADFTVRLAFEALSNRVGEATKRLVQLDPDLFTETEWTFASRHRDKVVHHYNSIDVEVLWSTVATHFPRLRELAHSKRPR
ncbi:MAG: DUF86 domain-containing protein [Salinibacterium sp.]|nr:DUF86 domain-containing protein [Salinibacterium sp.]